MKNKNPYERHSNGKRYKPMCSGWGVFPGGKKCKGCEDCNPKTNNMATKKKAPKKRKTAKQVAAQKKFAANAKKAAAMVKSGKAKTMKSAWAKLKK